MAKNFYNPYTFVPLCKEVYALSEDELKELELAHDVPFKNGRSGKIVVSWKAETPICVRQSDGCNTNVEGNYFIQGSSIKGMIRSVFEIITRSNFKNGISNTRYSMRDLRSPDYELKANNKPQKSGFLFQVNGDYYVKECYSEQWEYGEIENDENITGLKQHRSIEDKYNQLNSRIVEFDDDSLAMWFFSGFMNNKEHEFLFDIPQSFENAYPLKQDEFNDFRFIHEKENENASWKFWKRILRNYNSLEEIKKDGYKGIVPCFFRTFNKEGEKCVKDLGFSFLYRQPYSKRMHDFLPETHTRGGVDLAQSVFGYVDGSNALRGRIRVGNSFIANAKLKSKQTFILGSPKPSFYPFYLEQKNPNQLNTYFAKDACLSGYKRFLLKNVSLNGETPSSKVTSSFVPLSEGTEFSTTIYYHNLRDYELGALIAAITFCNKEKKCCHSLGYAKPFGYGRLRVVKIDTEGIDRVAVYKAFLMKLCDKLKIKETDVESQIKYLFTIAEGAYQDKPIRYPNMQKKEFNIIKNDKSSIKDYSPKGR